MTAALPGALLVKEGRALAPIWLGAVITIVAGTLAGLLMSALLAFILGAAALGVFSIGHEYAHRTLTPLLAQPLGRSQLLLSKVVVLAPMLVLLSVIAALVLLRTDGIERELGAGTLAGRWRLAIVVLTPLLGLCVAPWLTMVFRNVTAGLVFTLAVPSALWIAGQIGRAASVDFDFVDLEVGSPFGYGPALTLMTVGMLLVSAIAAVHGRKLFVGLEALDTPRDLLPSRAKRRRVGGVAAAASDRSRHRRRGPLFQFVKKEVRLYGLAFALTGLYAVAWIALWLARADTYLADDAFEALAGMFGLFIALLVASTSSAEERALGTADMQRLQPWPFWKLCLVRLATVGLIALSLGLAVPIGLEAALPLIDGSGWTVGPTFGSIRFLLPKLLGSEAATLLLMALFSCYVSTLCVGGLRALLVALPSSFTLVSLYLGLLSAIGQLESKVLATMYPPPPCTLPGAPDIAIPGCRQSWWDGLSTVSNTDFMTTFLYSRWTTTVALIGFAALILFLYVRNSRTGEGGVPLARKQLPWVAAYVALAAVVAGGGSSLLRWWLFTH